MKTIAVKGGYTAYVDDEDYARLSVSNWRSKKTHGLVYAFRHAPNGYNREKRRGKTTDRLMHREILGLTDRNVIVDHADGDGLNNVRANLRTTDRSGNAANSRKRRSATGYKGVTAYVTHDGVRYQARIKHYQRTYSIGSFQFALAAAVAYNASAHRRFGAFAAMNDVAPAPA